MDLLRLIPGTYRFIFSISLLICSWGLCSEVLVFDKLNHDFGTINESGGPVYVDFFYTNTGASPLAISNIKTSCGCTTPSWSRKTIEPGSYGIITVQFNPRNRPGRFTKKIVVTPSGDIPRKAITIFGIVKKATNVSLRPIQINFRDNYSEIRNYSNRLEKFSRDMMELTERNKDAYVKLTVCWSRGPFTSGGKDLMPLKKIANDIRSILSGFFKGKGLEPGEQPTIETKLCLLGPIWQDPSEISSLIYRNYQYIRLELMINE